MTSECKNCKRRFKLLGDTNECFECNQKEWYKKYPAKQTGDNKRK